MLVLSRKVGERIYIGNIEVLVCKIDRGRVRIGISTGDKLLPVVRQELLEGKKKIIKRPHAKE